MFLPATTFHLIVTSVCAGLILSSCASPRSPTGGPKDETPPAIIEAESTPNQQTHFKEKQIILTFDEWIILKDVYNQLVVSPVLPDDPEIKQRGKTITITLPDSLREETTYTFNFGNAITDLNEGNILENYSFVFSTGAVLDSARLSGTVTDAVTLKPAEGIWVMLHPFGLDSAVYKFKPEYLAKTNKEGRWAMANVRSDTFNIVALKDENINFLYDQETELFGWRADTIITSSATTAIPEIQVFPRVKKAAIKDVIHPAPGWIKLVIQSPLLKPVPELSPVIANTETAWDGDTLHIWYPPSTPYAGYAILHGDTSQIRVSPGTSSLSAPVSIQALSGRLHPAAPAVFMTRIPVSTIDTSRIMLIRDTSGAVPFRISRDSISSRKLMVRAAWDENMKYQLTFLPGAITDFWGRSNDTIRHIVVVNATDQFGDMTLHVSGLDSTMTYQVLIKQGDQVMGQFGVRYAVNTILHQNSMLPGKYVVEIIEDRNANGAWDTGDYELGRQPERKQVFMPENLRAGWELEVDIRWK